MTCHINLYSIISAKYVEISFLKNIQYNGRIKRSVLSAKNSTVCGSSYRDLKNTTKTGERWDYMNKRDKILTAAGIFTAAAAGFAAYTVKKLCDMAVKAGEIKFAPSGERILTGHDPQEVEAIRRESRSKALACNTERVEIIGSGGLKLVGHIYPTENQKRILIAMHGWRSSWTVDFGMSAEFFHQNGCTMIYPDQRGQGESEGDYLGFGVLERADCLDWINYTVERYGDKNPIYLCGVSMGATTVLMTAGYELPECVKGIIADCGFTSPKDIWQKVMRESFHLKGNIAYAAANYMIQSKAGYSGDDYSTLDALETDKIPVLFIHGEDDGFVPVEMTRKNYEACRAPKMLLTVPGADHAMSYMVQKEEYERTVNKFFDCCEGREKFETE